MHSLDTVIFLCFEEKPAKSEILRHYRDCCCFARRSMLCQLDRDLRVQISARISQRVTRCELGLASNNGLQVREIDADITTSSLQPTTLKRGGRRLVDMFSGRRNCGTNSWEFDIPNRNNTLDWITTRLASLDYRTADQYFKLSDQFFGLDQWTTFRLLIGTSPGELSASRNCFGLFLGVWV